MEPRHASADQLRAFLNHESSPADLVAVGDHLDACAECRALATSPAMGNRLEQALAGETHLTYEELEDLASGAAMPDHIQHCAVCAAELDDLRKFRASLDSAVMPQRTAARRMRWGWAAAVFAAGIVIAIVTRSPNDKGPASPGANPDEEREMAQVLQSGQLPRAKILDSLVKDRETLLSGDRAAATALKPASPVGTTILSDRPKFTWNTMANARWYRIAVYGANFEAIVTSPHIQGTDWTPDKPLPRGQILSWTVTASLPTGELTAPRSPEPEAKFEVLSAEDVARMQTVLDRSPHSDLLIAIRAGELGLRQETRAAAEAYAAANPASSAAAKLVQSARRPR